MCFKIAFYENGKFSSYVGPSFPYRSNAIAAITTYSIQIEEAGLEPIFSDSDCFTYERYGTTCVLKIEEVEE